MDRTLIKKYIDNQPKKVVAKMDLGKNNVPPENFPYELDEEGQIVDSESPAGIRLRYERLRKRVIVRDWNN